jgi:protein-tyrosine kinase
MTHSALPLRPSSPGATPERRMGKLLVGLGRLGESDIETVLAYQGAHSLQFGEAARRLGLISDADIEQAVAHQFNYPYLPAETQTLPAQLVVAHKPFSPQAELYRELRVQLMQQWFAKGNKSLAVIAANASEGTSVFIANLGLVFAQAHLSTVLIDANLRRPQQDALFKLPRTLGLSDMLAGRTSADNLLKVDGFDQLFVYPAGTRPPNPQELLSSRAFSDMHARLSQRFDVVLLDLAALAYGTDALAAAARTKGAVLLMRRHHTRVADVGVLVRKLKQFDAEIVSTVLVDF